MSLPRSACSGVKYTPRQADTPPMASQERIGTVTHYFGDIGVAVIEVESGELSLGDRVRVVGGDRDFTFAVDSMEVDHDPVEEVGAGTEVAMKVPEKARDGYEVYLAGEEE